MADRCKRIFKSFACSCCCCERQNDNAFTEDRGEKVSIQEVKSPSVCHEVALSVSDWEFVSVCAGISFSLISATKFYLIK